jgi:hypothetical protein
MRVGLGALVGASLAFASAAEAQPPDLAQGQEATAQLAVKAAKRMVTRCRPRFCMDPNDAEIACTVDQRPKFMLCSYRLLGYTFVGDDPVGDFDCQRPAKIGVRRRGPNRTPRIIARSVGKTKCGDDRRNLATYPWPAPLTECNDTFTIFDPPPIPHTAQCIAPPPKPKKTLDTPLKFVGGGVTFIDYG